MNKLLIGFLSLVLTTSASASSVTVPLQTVQMGPYRSDMSLEEAKVIAGGEIKCEEPIKSFCTLMVSTEKQKFFMTKGLSGETLFMERELRLPKGMTYKEIERRVMERWGDHGQHKKRTWEWWTRDRYAGVQSLWVEIVPPFHEGQTSTKKGQVLRSHWKNYAAERRNARQVKQAWELQEVK